MKHTYAFTLCIAALVSSFFYARAATVTITYTYDDAGRLTRADYGGEAAIDYVYDANGNLSQRIVTGDGEVTYTLIYRAGTGGSIDGIATQVVAAGESGTAVSAVIEDAGAVFARWSDGNPDPTRTDTDVQAGLDVTARFRSTGGTDLDWYSDRNIEPEGEETSWADVDDRPVPDKGTTLLHENIADTDPDEPTDRFEILAIDPGPPLVVTFRPGSTERVYTLQATDDLVSGVWTNVPGMGPRSGQGVGPTRQDAFTDTNASTGETFYRVEVELP